MMADAHPSEIELLELAEGELDEAARLAVLDHVERCAACADGLAGLESARSVLRASPVLELGADRRRSILAGLPDQEPVRRRPTLWELLTARRLAVVLAPVAAVVIAVVAITSTGGGGDRSAAKETPPAAAAEEAQADAAAPEAGAAGAETPPSAEAAPMLESAARAVRSVRGPAVDVVKLLEEKGIQARVVDGTVEVTGAPEQAVRTALDSLPDGTVPVVIAP